MRVWIAVEPCRTAACVYNWPVSDLGLPTLARTQERDEPTVVHFVGGESKPWLYMVLKFQGMAEKIPEGIRSLLHAWDQVLRRRAHPRPLAADRYCVRYCPLLSDSVRYCP